jgi:Putative Actinobacterial Holin-X, holin superfamily III
MTQDPSAGTGSTAWSGPPDTDNQARPLSSVGEIFSDISRDFSTLMRQEVALAKAELTQSASKAGKGAGMLGGAGVAGHFVLLFLSIALWWGLGNEIGRGWSALVVAVLWAVVAAVLAAMGRKEMKQVKGVPQTTETAKEIPNALKGNEDIR